MTTEVILALGRPKEKTDKPENSTELRLKRRSSHITKNTFRFHYNTQSVHNRSEICRCVQSELHEAHQHAVWVQQFYLMSLQTVQHSTATVPCRVIELLRSEPSSQQTTLQQFTSYCGK